MGRNWQEELPFLAWGDDGNIAVGLTDDGDWGLPCVDGTVIPFEDPRLTECRLVLGARMAEVLQDATDHLSKAYDMVADANNPEPFHRLFVQEHPEFIDWLNGDNPNYAPTSFEWKWWYPAYVERKRRLHEYRIAGERTADKKTDNGKKIPPHDVNECARYIVEQRKLIHDGKRPTATKKQLIIECVGENDAPAMDKQLQPSRFGWLLEISGQADK